MADTKISALTELTTADADDVLPVVDTSATTTKKMQRSNLLFSIITCPKFYGSAAGGTTRYADTGGTQTSSGQAGNVMTRAGTVRNLQIIFYSNSINAGSLVFTVRKNAVDTTLTATAAAGATTTVADTTHSFTVAAGDIIDIKLVCGGASGTADWGFSYEVC